MGKQALISQSKGKKHIEKMKYASKAKQEQPQLKSFFLPKSTKDTTSTETARSEDLKVSDPSAGIAKASTSAPSTSLTQCISKDDVLTAEVLWAIKTVMSHFSMNNSANTSELFKTMFPDSQIYTQGLLTVTLELLPFGNPGYVVGLPLITIKSVFLP